MDTAEILGEEQEEGWLILPYPPTVNTMYRHKGWTDRKTGEMKFSVSLTEKAKNFRASAGWVAKEQGARVQRGTLHVDMKIYKPREEGDIDNVIKATFDALNWIAWEDDRQIQSMNIAMFVDFNDPRVEIKVRSV